METANSAKSTQQVVEEIMNLHRSLPTRPGIEEVEAAKVLISNVDKEDQVRLEAIEAQAKSPDVPEELFKILLDMQKNLIYFHSKEQKREALKLLDLEGVHHLFDELIQRASKCVSSPSNYQNPTISTPSSSSPSSSTASLTRNSTSPSVSGSASTSSSAATLTSYHSDKFPTKIPQLFSRDDSYVPKGKSPVFMDGIGARQGVSSPPLIKDSSLNPAIPSGTGGEKLSLIKLASLIEVSAKKGTREIDLRSKLADQLDWLPDSIGKLSSLITLDLSENRIVALPTTIGALSQLRKLDLHANRISELPEAFTDLIALVSLDLRGNQLVSLPAFFGKLVHLEELDLSANMLNSIPESIGNLVKLRKLNLETNNIEEIPHSIGRCSSLRELCADYNRLKALPEAVGKIVSLEILSVRYNNIKQLPTTMSYLSNLRELDVSFNELESVPESLCFATNLVKVNVGNNFADLRSLPRSIGNLEMLEELDISNNQIRFLPDSFRMLTRLRILKAEENPFELPPRQIFENGAQAVVQYMTELHKNRDVQPIKQKKSWTQRCFFIKSSKRQRESPNLVRA